MARIALCDARGPLNDLNDKLSGEDGDIWLDALKKMLRKDAPRGTIQSVKLPHVADGEVFELTLDFDAPKNQPLQMVRSDGYDGNWRHNGPTIKGVQTRRFKWVAVGYCRNFDELREKLAHHGRIPEGQWREAVKTKFQHDGVHARGIADASWVGPYARAHYPCVRSGGDSGFGGIGFNFDDDERWLVEVSE